jgi:ATP-dependent helicase/nuclease subunit A
MDLTPKQREAVTASGSVAVTAGAGTGKTAMLAERFVHHIVNDGLSPLEIVAVTFTEKAAAELRSRIRNVLLQLAGQDRAAEADAAQISTIHSLAARICRDFFDRAGVPADFRILDETDAELLLAEWFDEALGATAPDVVTGLGYSWLSGALRGLFSDPPAAEAALANGENELRRFVERARETAVVDLMNSEAWRDAEAHLGTHKGLATDPVENRRLEAIDAMRNIAARNDIDQALRMLKGFAANHGSPARWPNGGLKETRDRLIALRDAFKNCAETRGLEFGDADREMCRKIGLLRQAFESARDFIQNAKLERRFLDFADLEHYALVALNDNAVRGHYAERWRAILVDEFQDTNPVQEKILNALTAAGTRLTIVGDAKQSIYGFRRADPRVFERFRRSIGNDVVLDKTFRTHKGLADPLNAVFSKTLGDKHQPLEAERKTLPHDGPFIEAHSFCDDTSDISRLRDLESGYIAGRIARLLNDGTTIWDKRAKQHRAVRPSDIAVLSRTRAPLDIYIEDLLRAGIPAVNTGGGNLLETRVAKDVSVLLRFAADQADDIALVSILRGPFFAVSDRVLYELSCQKKKEESWWHLIGRSGNSLKRERTVISDFLAASRSLNAEHFIGVVDELTGYTSVIANLEQGERYLADWFGIVDLLRRFASLGRSDVVGVVRYLDELNTAGVAVPRPPVDAGDAVSLMTVHAAKGLEWPVVFVTNLGAESRGDRSTVAFDAEIGCGFKVTIQKEDGTYSREEPAVYKLIRKRKKDDQTAESARLLYVALTRACDWLYLTSAGKQRSGVDPLMAGLEDAGISLYVHDASFRPSAETWTTGRSLSRAAWREQLESVSSSFDSISVTAFVEYSICPRRFKYSYIDRHPGIGEGTAVNAKEIGSLVHTALEMGYRSKDELRPFSGGASNEVLDEAMRIAENYYSSDEFLEFRRGNPMSEVSATLEINGLSLSCKADRVGDDYVLDFKTDAEVIPDEHLLQLWAYSRAFDKPRAAVAYLRQGKVYQYSSDELSQAFSRAVEAAAGVSQSRFDATPTERGCRKCPYSTICDERI